MIDDIYKKHSNFIKSLSVRSSANDEPLDQIDSKPERNERLDNIFDIISNTISRGEVVKLDEFGFKSTPYYKEFIKNKEIRNVKSVSPKRRYLVPIKSKNKQIVDSFDEVLSTINIKKMTKREIADFWDKHEVLKKLGFSK